MWASPGWRVVSEFSQQNCENTFCFTNILLYISETLYICNEDKIARFNNFIKQQFVNIILQNMSSNAGEVEPHNIFFPRLNSLVPAFKASDRLT